MKTPIYGSVAVLPVFRVKIGLVRGGDFRQEKTPTEIGWGLVKWWWGSTPHQTTIESTESKRCGLLRTIANSIEKAA